MPPTQKHASQNINDPLGTSSSRISGETNRFVVSADKKPFLPQPTARAHGKGRSATRGTQRENVAILPDHISQYIALCPQASRTLQPDAAEFVPGGIPPVALHQQQYPDPQISYQYGAIPNNFMVCYLGFAY